MSLADNKRSVFTTIGSYNSLMEQGNDLFKTDSFSSINNKDDIVPFLLDVLKTVAGTMVIKEAIGGLFGEVIDKSEAILKTALKKQFIQSNSNDVMSSSFMINGITVPVKDIDIGGKLKINPNSSEGNLIYGSVTNTFNSVAYDAILNSGTYETFNNINIKYVEALDSFQIKPNGSAQTIGEFFINFIDNTELINKKELISSVMDKFYGTLSNNQNKTISELYDELLIETQLQQVLDDDDSFVILPDKYDELLTKANELAEGDVSYDLGCGLMPASLSFDDFSNLVSTISGATDPFFIGDKLGETIEKSTDLTDTLTTENKETIKDSFFQRIIKILTVKMLEAITTAPQIRVLMGIMSSLQNDGVILISKATEDLKYFKTIIKCLAKEIIEIVGEYLFTLAISYLIKLIKPVITKVLKEKINQYKGIITSLTGVSNFIN